MIIYTSQPLPESLYPAILQAFPNATIFQPEPGEELRCVMWSTSDVKDAVPGLSQDQALQILEQTVLPSDEYGINYDTFRNAAEELQATCTESRTDAPHADPSLMPGTTDSLLSDLTETLMQHGISREQAEAQAKQTLTNIAQVQPGSSYGGQWPEDLAGLWTRAANSGARRLNLTITAEGETQDVYHGHLNVHIEARQNWDDPRTFEVSGIKWDSDDAEYDRLPEEAVVTLPKDQCSGAQLQAHLMQQLAAQFGTEALSFRSLKEVLPTPQPEQDAAEQVVRYVSVSGINGYDDYQQEPHSRENDLMEASFATAAEALEDADWTHTGSGWTHAEHPQPVSEARALELADVVAITRYPFTADVPRRTVWAFSRASAAHTAQNYLEEADFEHHVKLG